MQQFVRKYFNCSDADGAELENDGGFGTAGSHWEKRLFGYFSGMHAVLEDMNVIHGTSVTGADKYTDHCPMWQDVFLGDKSIDVGDMVCDNNGNRPDSYRNIGLEIYGSRSICVEQAGIFIAMECLPPRMLNLIQTRFDTMYGAGCYQKNGFVCEPDMPGINAKDYTPSPCGGYSHLSVKWLILAHAIGNLLLKLLH
ncbi:Peptidase M8 domain containing protein [Trichuris trichiura]|uniref:Leishmanolysin-like peptidase n=1 Tax=Trichuris trichiura TaxID=36087 RepID=A0A077Z5E1_TRITR|nr:Peptidase M8 domain containing protein [Trichuris trichiura]